MVPSADKKETVIVQTSDSILSNTKANKHIYFFMSSVYVYRDIFIMPSDL